MRRSILAALLVLGMAGAAFATEPPPTVVWSTIEPGTAQDDKSPALAIDANGDIFQIVTSQSGQAWGPGLVPSLGMDDTWLVKYDSGGNKLFESQLGTAGNEVANELLVDGNGDVVITGYSSVYDLDGNVIGGGSATAGWVMMVDGSTGAKTGHHMIDPAYSNPSPDWNLFDYASESRLVGNTLYVAGTAASDFGDTTNHQGSGDAMITMIDLNTGVQTHKLLGSTDPAASMERGYALDVDAAGDLYMVGSMWGWTDLPNAIAGTGADSAGFNTFVAKMDSAGDVIWTHEFGGAAAMQNAADSTNDILVDADGNSYVSGYRENGAAIPGSTNTTGQASLYRTLYLRKINADGTHAWTQEFGSIQNDYTTGGLEFDIDGNVLMAGYFWNAIFGAPNGAEMDAGLAKFDAATGTFLWGLSLDDTMGGDMVGDTRFDDLKVDANGDFILTGRNSTSTWTTGDAWLLKLDSATVGVGLTGDFDGDGDVDADDIDDLCANMGGDAGTYDMDSDGDVDEDDMTFHVENHLEYDSDGDGTADGSGTFRGDFNTDGTVNGTDLSIMSGGFGTSTGFAGGNANCDVTVNGTDLSILSSVFGNVASAAVPEPLTIGLLGLGGMALLRRRR